MRDISHIVIHCSNTYEDQNIGISDLRRSHKAAPRKLSDVGYHYLVMRNGGVQRGRDLGTPGDHAKGYDKDSIGVCWAGGKALNGWPEDNRTDDQKSSLRNLLSRLEKHFPKAKIIGHNELPGVTKTCPNFNVSEWYYETDAIRNEN